MIRRKSKQRDTILEVLRGVKTHPDADWIYEKVRESIPNISLGTVYRNLSQLEYHGEILKLDTSSGTSHYDGNIFPHSHIVCRGCGRIDDLDEKVPDELVSYGRERYKGEVETLSLVYFGKCESCADLK